MNKRAKLLLGLVLVAALAAAGFGAFARVSQVMQAAPVCNSTSKPVSTPPAQVVTAADYLTLGDYDFEQGNCSAAIADYTQAIAGDPEMAEAYNNRAYSEMAQQNYAAALPDLNQAIELRPDYVNALMNRGDIYNYYYDIDDDKAIADYDRVLGLQPQGTSVCGHRLLAQHHGWNLGVLVTIIAQRDQAGCN